MPLRQSLKVAADAERLIDRCKVNGIFGLAPHGITGRSNVLKEPHVNVSLVSTCLDGLLRAGSFQRQSPCQHCSSCAESCKFSSTSRLVQCGATSLCVQPSYLFEVFAICLAEWGGELSVGGADPSNFRQVYAVSSSKLRL